MINNLGNITRNYVPLMVKNNSATVTIRKGEPVSWSVAASNPKVNIARAALTINKDLGSGTFDPQTTDEVPLIEVVPGINDPNTNMGTLNSIGVAVRDIKPGEVGEVASFGIVKCKIVAAAPQTAGSTLFMFGPMGGAGSDIVFKKAANTNWNICGVQLVDSTITDGVTAELIYCFVNFIGHGRNGGAAYVQSTQYYGKAP